MPEIATPPPLEDAWNDVLSKAIRGTGIEDKNLAPSANIIPSQLKSILNGERPSEDTLRRLAIAVGLRPTPFLDLAFGRYHPQPFDSKLWPGVEPISTDYLAMIVNCYLLFDGVSGEAVLFDTGTELSAIEKRLERHGVKLTTLCLTHSHGDHIALLNEVKTRFQPKIYASKGEPVPGATLIEEGAEISVGKLRIRTLWMDGHSEGHLSYVVTGHESWPAPVAITGDTLFAGSMGGGAVSYSTLKENVQTKLLTLSPSTLVCPGHGPTTTIGEEDQHNPFA